MPDAFAALKSLLEIFPYPVRIAFIVLALACAALFLPSVWQTHMGIQSFTATHKVIEWTMFVGSATLILTVASESATKTFKHYQWMRYRVARLTPLELQTITILLTNPDHPLTHWEYDPEVVRLFRDKLLWRQPMVPNGLYLYSLRNSSRKYLERHFARLEKKAKSSS
jgi:hypothetical protein